MGLSDEGCDETLNSNTSVLKDITINVRAEICAAHISFANVSLVNVTNTGSENKYVLINDEQRRTIENQQRMNLSSLFKSKRIKNNRDLPKFSQTSNTIIGGSDTCGGDSGGPLWTVDNITNHAGERLDNVAVLLGIVSRGLDCAAANRPGIYGRVRKVWKWIRSVADKPQNYTYNREINLRCGPSYHKQRPFALQKGNFRGEQSEQNFTVYPYCRTLVNKDGDPINRTESAVLTLQIE